MKATLGSDGGSPGSSAVRCVACSSMKLNVKIVVNYLNKTIYSDEVQE
jgi:hypothetical protein